MPCVKDGWIDGTVLQKKRWSSGIQDSPSLLGDFAENQETFASHHEN